MQPIFTISFEITKDARFARKRRIPQTLRRLRSAQVVWTRARYEHEQQRVAKCFSESSQAINPNGKRNPSQSSADCYPHSSASDRSYLPTSVCRLQSRRSAASALPIRSRRRRTVDRSRHRKRLNNYSRRVPSKPFPTQAKLDCAGAHIPRANPVSASSRKPCESSRYQKLNRSMLLLLKTNGAPRRTSSSATSIFPTRPAVISLSPRFSCPDARAFAA